MSNSQSEEWNGPAGHDPVRSDSPTAMEITSISSVAQPPESPPEVNTCLDSNICKSGDSLSTMTSCATALSTCSPPFTPLVIGNVNALNALSSVLNQSVQSKNEQSIATSTQPMDEGVTVPLSVFSNNLSHMSQPAGDLAACEVLKSASDHGASAEISVKREVVPVSIYSSLMPSLSAGSSNLSVSLTSGEVSKVSSVQSLTQKIAVPVSLFANELSQISLPTVSSSGLFATSQTSLTSVGLSKDGKSNLSTNNSVSKSALASSDTVLINLDALSKMPISLLDAISANRVAASKPSLVMNDTVLINSESLTIPSLTLNDTVILNPVLTSKPSLTFGDTVIVSPESISKPSAAMNDTVIINTDTLEATSSVNMLSSEGDERKPSLLSNISDRSVSLDSIPSVGLFRANQTQVESTGASDPNKSMAIIGQGGLPEWLAQLLQRQKHQSSESEQTEQGTGRKESAQTQETSPTVLQSDHEGNKTPLRKEDDVDDFNSDQTPGKKSKQSSLERADTLILDSVSDMTQAAESTTKVASAPNNLSFGSLVPLLAADSTHLINAALGSHGTEKQESDVSLSVPTGLLGDGISQVLYPVKLTSEMLRPYIQIGSEVEPSLIRNLTLGATGPQLMVQPDASNSSLLLYGNSASQTSTAKETQTDMVLGTSTVYFKPIDCVPSELGLDTGHVPTTILAMTIPHTEQEALSLSSLQQNNRIDSVQLVNTSVPSQPLVAKEVMGPPVSDNTEDQVSSTYDCVSCQDKFDTKEALDTHKKSHKKFKCDLCNAWFTRMGNFTRHRKIHNLHAGSQSGFKCEDCGREFLQRCDLKRHILIHTKQEPYRCDICNKGYIRRSDLVVHKRFHNKDRAFQCKLCTKRFFQSGDLNRHIRRAHEPDSQLTCGHCERKYACESTLIRHMKDVHKDIILQAVKTSEPDEESQLAASKKVLYTKS